MKKALDMVKAAAKAAEPVFVLRAKDKHALYAIQQYLIALNGDSQVSDDFINEIHQIEKDFSDFQVTKPESMKSPD